MNKAIKYRLYPTTEQCVMFAKTFGCCRKVYNLMLDDKISSYQESGRFVSVTPAMYKKDYPYLKEIDSLALANVQLNLQRAFKACFDKTRNPFSIKKACVFIHTLLLFLFPFHLPTWYGRWILLSKYHLFH